MRPSELATWPPQDRGLALALTLMEDTTSAHGHPVDVTLDPRSEGEFEVRTVIDQEQAVLDQWHRQNEKPPAGTCPYVVWVGDGSAPESDVQARLA